MMNVHTVTLASLGVFALAFPCSGPQLPSNVGDAVKVARDVKEVGDELGKCDALARREVAWEEERALGEAAAIELVSARGYLLHGTKTSGAGTQSTVYLNRVGRLLAEASSRPTAPWAFGIIDSDEVNAFSTPGGFVFVTRGLLAQVKNEAQLAGVLAHEIAHVTERHALDHYRGFKASRCRAAFASRKAGEAASVVQSELLRAFDAPGGFIDFSAAPELLAELGADVAGAIVARRVEPEKETAADRVALELLVAAGYQPEAYVAFLGTLPETFQRGSHPPRAERIAATRAAIADMEKDALWSAGAPFGEAEGFRAPALLHKEIAAR